MERCEQIWLSWLTYNLHQGHQLRGSRWRISMAWSGHVQVAPLMGSPRWPLVYISAKGRGKHFIWAKKIGAGHLGPSLGRTASEKDGHRPTFFLSLMSMMFGWEPLVCPFKISNLLESSTSCTGCPVQPILQTQSSFVPPIQAIGGSN